MEEGEKNGVYRCVNVGRATRGVQFLRTVANAANRGLNEQTAAAARYIDEIESVDAILGRYPAISKGACSYDVFTE